ncbi:pilus assembly protein [Diaphorobacter aerolatus]|nr:PilC/PilY family type IV pilus protein [Diaphorobacter aerolatus]
MVNFTVDFGGASAAPDTYADYDQLLVGTLAWPDPFASIDAMRQDLRHAALNSRGQHFQIGPSVDQLKQAMSGVIARIVPSDGQVISGYASNGGNATYVAAYEASGWSGQIHASLLEPGPEKGVPNPEWGLPPRHSTAASLDSLASVDQRVILTHNGATDQGGGIPLRWQSLSLAQQAQLQSHGSSASYAQNLVQFLRGDRSLESNDPSTGFRMRRSRQGDIVHSRIWHVGKPMSGHADKGYRDFSIQHASRPPVLYVGGNDGMLHGFSARTGDELVAYVPLGAHPHLHLLAAQDYRHRYYVDGSPFTGDALIGTQWKTFLVGAMGAGGPGYFVLDATSPERFSESAASELVVMDRTDGSDPDVGHIFAAPTLDEANARRALQITRLNNGRWAVVLGNGYGSANGRPVLLIQYLDGARELIKIAATAPSPTTAGKTPMVANGLSAPQFLDVNSDGIPDAVYAGDLQGRLWKFDIAAASDQRWAVALGGAPLFTAVRNGKSQPITVAPVLRVHPEVGV